MTEITVSPLKGSIGPGATVTVEASCSSGRDPAKVRGSIECHILDPGRGSLVNRVWIGYRVDIQVMTLVEFCSVFELLALILMIRNRLLG